MTHNEAGLSWDDRVGKIVVSDRSVHIFYMIFKYIILQCFLVIEPASSSVCTLTWMCSEKKND